jgi:hypothetical protein
MAGSHGTGTSRNVSASRRGGASATASKKSSSNNSSGGLKPPLELSRPAHWGTRESAPKVMQPTESSRRTQSQRGTRRGSGARVTASASAVSQRPSMVRDRGKGGVVAGASQRPGSQAPSECVSAGKVSFMPAFLRSTRSGGSGGRSSQAQAHTQAGREDVDAIDTNYGQSPNLMSGSGGGGSAGWHDGDSHSPVPELSLGCATLSPPRPLARTGNARASPPSSGKHRRGGPTSSFLRAYEKVSKREREAETRLINLQEDCRGLDLGLGDAGTGDRDHQSCAIGAAASSAVSRDDPRRQCRYFANCVVVPTVPVVPLPPSSGGMSGFTFGQSDGTGTGSIDRSAFRTVVLYVVSVHKGQETVRPTPLPSFGPGMDLDLGPEVRGGGGGGGAEDKDIHGDAGAALSAATTAQDPCGGLRAGTFIRAEFPSKVFRFNLSDSVRGLKGSGSGSGDGAVCVRLFDPLLLPEPSRVPDRTPHLPAVIGGLPLLFCVNLCLRLDDGALPHAPTFPVVY